MTITTYLRPITQAELLSVYPIIKKYFSSEISSILIKENIKQEDINSKLNIIVWNVYNRIIKTYNEMSPQSVKIDYDTLIPIKTLLQHQKDINLIKICSKIDIIQEHLRTISRDRDLTIEQRAFQIREWFNDKKNKAAIQEMKLLNLSGLDLTEVPKIL